MYFEKESFLHFSKCITVAQVADLFLHVGLARNFQLALSPAFQKSLWVINHVITLQTGTTGWRKFLDPSAVFSHISSSTCSFVDKVEILSVSACLTTIFIDMMSVRQKKWITKDGLCQGCVQQIAFWSFQETSQAVDQAGRQERGRRQELKGGRWRRERVSTRSRAHQPQSHLPAQDQPWRSDFASLSPNWFCCTASFTQFQN